MSVPVLSERIYLTLPSSSGILLFLAVDSGIFVSLLIPLAKYSLARSRLTLMEIGIIEERRINILIN